MLSELIFSIMQVVIIPPRKPECYQPLTGRGELGDLLVANVPLHSWIELQLRQAGCQVLQEGEENLNTIYYPLDHWIEVGALCMLGRAESGTKLVDGMGDVVAWKGKPKAEDCDKQMVTDADCFRIEYAWDLLKLNEDVLDQIAHGEVC